MWHVMGVTQGAGLSLRWLRDMVGGGLSYDQLCEAAAGVPPGCDGARWTPYLMGERTPHLDPDARAALAGLTASHTRGHLVRAVLEGVTFSLQDSFAIFAEMGVPVTGVRLGGGGAKSPLWRQIQADVYGHTAEIVGRRGGRRLRSGDPRRRRRRGVALGATAPARPSSRSPTGCRRSPTRWPRCARSTPTGAASIPP